MINQRFEDMIRLVEELLSHLKEVGDISLAHIEAIRIILNCMGAMVKAEMPKEKAFSYFEGMTEHHCVVQEDCRPIIASRDMEIEELKKQVVAANKGAEINARINRDMAVKINQLQSQLAQLRQEKEKLKKPLEIRENTDDSNTTYYK